MNTAKLKKDPHNTEYRPEVPPLAPVYITDKVYPLGSMHPLVGGVLA